MATLVGRQPRGGWQFLTAFPTDVVTTPSSDVNGAAEVRCIFWRPCVFWFVCNGRYFPVMGRQYLTTDPGPGNIIPVFVAAVPLPFRGFLGGVADALGVSLTIGVWFTPKGQGQADVVCANPGADAKPSHEQYETPTCTRTGAKIGDSDHEWPNRVLLEELPDSVDAEEDD